MQKDKAIKNVLAGLFQQFGETNFTITDFWDGDLSAIGIKNSTDKKHLIYISTYKLPGDLFFVEVEKANSKTKLTDYSVIGKFEKIDFDELSEIVSKYLYLQPII
jgi:hypothetical protein